MYVDIYNFVGKTDFGALLDPLFLFCNEKHSLEGLLHLWTDVVMVAKQEGGLILERIIEVVTVLRTPVTRPVHVMHFTIGTIAIIPAIIDIYYRFFFDYITKLLHKPSCGHANGTLGGLNPRLNNFVFQAFLQDLLSLNRLYTRINWILMQDGPSGDLNPR